MEREESLEFLETAAVARMGMIADGEPYVVPLHFVLMDDQIYFHSAPEGRKIRALQENPSVCLEVDVFYGIRDDKVPCSMGTYFRSVMVFGEATAVVDPAEAINALEALVDKHSRRPDRSAITEDDMDQVVVMKISPEHITGKVLDAPAALREPV